MRKARVILAIALCIMLMASMVACQPTPAPDTQPSEQPAPSAAPPAKPEPEPAAGYTPGSYMGAFKGMYGDIPVTVTVSEAKIESIFVGENSETLGIGDVAALEIPARIIEAQSLAVDVVSGATITSFAIINAARLALQDAGADIAALTVAAPEAALEQGPVETVDIVIVGAGLAGLNAAYDLKIKNPDVSYVLLEKRDLITGSLPLSGGTILATKSKLHSKLGVESTLEDVISLMKGATGGEPVRENLISSIYANSEELFNRLVDWGAPLYSEGEYFNPYTKVNPVPSSGSTNPNVYTFFSNGSGGAYAKFWYDLIAKEPIHVRTHSKVTDLIATEGKVTGVKVQDKEKEYEIHAKAVILTTGGFGSNPEYVKAYSPNYVGNIARSNSGAMGDGIDLTRQFGTEIVGRGMISGEAQAALNVSPIGSTFVVSQDGERVGNEASLHSLTAMLINGSGTKLFMLLDSNFADKDKLQQHIDARVLEPYNTLEELAQAKGIDAAKLTATVAAYNAAVDAGESPGFDLPLDRAMKLETAPFYAEQIFNSWSGSVPGILVDDEMRVLDESGEIVPGLYAAGELTTGNMYWGGFPGLGVAGSYATYSGPYAARNAVSDLNK